MAQNKATSGSTSSASKPTREAPGKRYKVDKNGLILPIIVEKEVPGKPHLKQKMYQCPYFDGHLVMPAKIEGHLNRCRKNYLLEFGCDRARAAPIQACKFDLHHLVTREGLQLHEEECYFRIREGKDQWNEIEKSPWTSLE